MSGSLLSAAPVLAAAGGSMESSSSFPWLTVIGCVPLVGGAVLFALPRGRDLQAKRFALFVSLITLALTMAMCSLFVASDGGFQFVQRYAWIERLGIDYHVGVDGIALTLIGLIAVLMPIIILASWHEIDGREHSVKNYFGLLLILETLMVGVFASLDVFLFYVFFEAMLVPMYFLIGQYGGPRRQYAAMKFLLYSLLGGALMLAALIGLYVISGRSASGATFSLPDLIGNIDATPGVAKFLFLGFFIAFAIKAPLWPFHTWLPDAGAEAPIGTAALLVAVLDKVGTYGFLRYCIELFPDAARFWAPYVVGLAVMGVLYGALVAIGQRDMKRLVSYTSVSHFGFIALGCFAMTSQGQSGAVLYMLNHGLSTGALFLVVGFLIHRRRSRMIGDYGGVSMVAPVLGGTFLAVGLSSLALPGLSTFVSEFLVLVGSFTRYRVAAILATLGIVLAALYILWMYQRVFHGPLERAVAGFRDLSVRETVVIGPLIALMVVFGFYPKPILDVINPAVARTLQHAGVTDPAPSVGAVQGDTTPLPVGGSQ